MVYQTVYGLERSILSDHLKDRNRPVKSTKSARYLNSDAPMGARISHVGRSALFISCLVPATSLGMREAR